MEYLPFELLQEITQYTGVVYPKDIDYDRLLEYTIKNNRPGQLRILLNVKAFKNINTCVSIYYIA